MKITKLCISILIASISYNSFANIGHTAKKIIKKYKETPIYGKIDNYETLTYKPKQQLKIIYYFNNGLCTAVQYHNSYGFKKQNVQEITERYSEKGKKWFIEPNIKTYVDSIMNLQTKYRGKNSKNIDLIIKQENHMDILVTNRQYWSYYLKKKRDKKTETKKKNSIKKYLK